MVLETYTTSGVYPSYFSPTERLVSYSEEQCMLMQFCHNLATSHHVTDASPNDFVETRKQAKLLMSLMSKNSTSRVHSIDSDRSSSLERCSSDQSFASHNSLHSSSRRDKFSFVCPSLSLENSSSHAYIHDVAREVSGMHANDESSDHVSQPAHLLLGRSLKVDDPDALRLSADAMARNVLQSFEKSMNWRIRAWMYVLSRKVVEYEQQMLSSGASIEDLRTILHTPEAKLIVALQALTQDHRLVAETAITSFEVLSQRIERPEDAVRHCNRPASASSSSSLTNSDEVASLSSDHSTDTIGSHSMESSYLYVAAHELRFCCTVQMQTLAGFTEIALTVPGTIAGTFESSELDPTAQLKSVKVDVNTNVLASLIDKACRTIVRTSVEKLIAQPEIEASTASDCNESTDVLVQDNVIDAVATEESFTLSSPPAAASSMTQTSSACAFVSPGPHCSDHSYHCTPRTDLLFPIPDDLQRRALNGKEFPRRISPQPMSRRNSLPTGSNSSAVESSMMNYHHFESSTRPSSLKRRTPPPMRWDDQETATTTAIDSVQFLRQRHSVPQLVSPPAAAGVYESHEFHHVPDYGPSIPMLVEAACQIANGNR